MASIKKEKNNTYSIQFRYKNYAGVNCRKHKYNFKTKKEATAWMNEFIRKEQSDVCMTFQSFYQEYLENQSADLRASTLATKEHIVALHIMPYFKDRELASITAEDIIKWQNKIKKKGFSDSYLNTIHGQLSAIFNHACRIYNLSFNPCKVAGGMGNKDSGNMGIWMQEEMERFLNAVSDKPVVKYAFFLLYWTGIRLGDDDDKIRLNQRKPSKYKGLSRFGPEKNLQRINKFMKERPIFYKNLIQMKENFRFYLRCFYCITKVVILQFNSENRTELARNG